MKLKEKFNNALDLDNDKYIILECEKVADDFAIGFAEWIQNNCDEFPKEDQELILKIYKKEKGL